jgi:hypothetical protein
MRNLVVGQDVLLFGVGFLDGKVLSVVPSIAVQADDGLLQFDENGRETDHSRYLRCGIVANGPCPSLLPWEIVATTPEEMAARRRTHDLINLEACISNVLTQLEAGKVEFAKSHAQCALQVVNAMRHSPTGS